MNRRSPILEALAELYASSKPGQTGRAERDFSVPFLRLFQAAQCMAGDRYQNALSDLAQADGAAVRIVRNKRSGDVERITVPLDFEPALFATIGSVAPTARRQAWAAMFLEMMEAPIPAEYAADWKNSMSQRAERIQNGEGWQPFRRGHRQRARQQLLITAQILGWKQPALLRTVSAHLAQDSKFLERSRGTIETLLAEVSDGRLKSFTDLQITDNPRHVIFHGPLRIALGGGWSDYSRHAGASSLSEDDLAGHTALECAAPRCVTVENMTTFHALCRLGCGDLFVFTSYPNRATVELLRRLPADLPRFHFGDTDPWGFDVLRTLREVLRPIPIQALHMAYREASESELLDARDHRTLRRLLADPLVADVHEQLARMFASGSKGSYEQETIPVAGRFPYRNA